MAIKSIPAGSWQCECGKQAPQEKGEHVVHMKTAVFRKEGCPNCRRPMMILKPEKPRRKAAGAKPG